jgi:hypothetical protein
MKHNIEISTVEALLIVQLLHENNLSNETDKIIVKRLKDMIIKKVSSEFSNEVSYATR